MTPTATAPGLPFHISRLLAVLDEQARLLELRCEQLEQLSAAIIERADDRMEALLGEMAQTLELQQAIDGRLAAVRADIVTDLGADSGRWTLRKLAAALDDAQGEQVEARRRQVAHHARKLRAQHAQTSLLLIECARVNRMLLEAMLPDSAGLQTYATDGARRWRPPAGTVSAER